MEKELSRGLLRVWQAAALGRITAMVEMIGIGGGALLVAAAGLLGESARRALLGRRLERAMASTQATARRAAIAEFSARRRGLRSL